MSLAIYAYPVRQVFYIATCMAAYTTLIASLLLELRYSAPSAAHLSPRRFLKLTVDRLEIEC
jgi:hypothetical protein